VATDTTALARRWRLDLNAATDVAPDWQQVIAISEFVPKYPPNIEDSSVYDDGGWAGNAKTGQAWSIELTISRKIDENAKTYVPTHEQLRLAAFASGSASRVPLRFMDRNGLPEAYQGKAIVTWEPQGGEYTALDTVKVTLTGDGPLVPITNPLA
jgi:hypothetical protein